MLQLLPDPVTVHKMQAFLWVQLVFEGLAPVMTCMPVVAVLTVALSVVKIQVAEALSTKLKKSLFFNDAVLVRAFPRKLK